MLSGANTEVLTATGNVTTGGNASAAKVILTGGSAAATLILYDAASATGDLKIVLAAPANVMAAADDQWIAINSGNIHLVLTGTGVNATVYWK